MLLNITQFHFSYKLFKINLH